MGPLLKENYKLIYLYCWKDQKSNLKNTRDFFWDTKFCVFKQKTLNLVYCGVVFNLDFTHKQTTFDFWPFGALVHGVFPDRDF